MPPKSAEQMAAMRAMPRLRLQPVNRERLARCATESIRHNLFNALEATGRYTVKLSALFTDKTFLFTDAPDDVLLILSGGGRAVTTQSMRLRKR